jgi:hypothetical protein
MITSVLALALAAQAAPGSAGKDRTMRERFLPIAGMSVTCPAQPTDAEAIAVNRFVREVHRIAGITLPVRWGSAEAARACILVGNRATLADRFAKGAYALPPDRQREDTARQSYVVDAGARGSVVLAAGFGDTRTARGHLGTGYALGELLRRLDIRQGRWGLVLPDRPIVATPRMPQRTLYIMNSSLRNPGLSVEHFSDAEIEDYVDRLVEARYSRICHWQWSVYYLLPGNAPDYQTDRQLIHRGMRKLYDRARQRGLEVYHMLTPSHLDTVPGPAMRAKGHYAPWSVCWSHAGARELARRAAQLEMEYYAPVDGYAVWFYDPGGCFCEECAAHQSERIFDQLMTVVNLAGTISPGARFQAGLWPTWAFARTREGIGYPDRGYTDDDVKQLVSGFLHRCLEKFGPRNLTIIDSCEGEETNLYNGLVKPSEFKRSAFMYTVLGMASEQAYPFAPFRLRYLAEQMQKARDRGVEEAQLFIQYSATNFPAVYAFADTLYETDNGWQAAAGRLASTLARGEARKPFLDLLQAMDDLNRADTAAAMEQAIGRMEAAASTLRNSPHFTGDRDWLNGYVLAQRRYFEMARAADDAAFTAILDRFRKELQAIPMWRDYAARTLDASLARSHIKTYWSLILPQAGP